MVDPQFLNCILKIYGPKNNFEKFKKNLDVEIFSITSSISYNCEVFCMNDGNVAPTSLKKGWLTPSF